MKEPYQKEELFVEKRLAIHEVLAENPNYFGTAPETDLPVELPIQFNTSYEELTCVGLWPEKNQLEATILVKLPFGFLGEMCTPGSHEHVRFFIDWDNDGDFDDPHEDIGVAKVNVHDIPQVEKDPLCYAVPLPFLPFLPFPIHCKDPYIVKLRAILSWEVEPPPGDWKFVPIWGNVLECWVQIEPTEGQIVGIVTEEEAEQEKPSEGEPEKAEAERVEFLKLIEENPNYFGTAPETDYPVEQPIQFNTSYEELKCIGLYPEMDFLEAILTAKLPYGFLGDLCTPGSYEYVRFFIDWDNDGDFVDANEDAGVAAVNVHDIPQVEKFHLCYALGRQFQALRAKCEKPYIVRVRAILSWQQVPTGPDFIPVWGNVVECWVQINPTEPPLEQLIGEIHTPVADDCVQPASVPACMTDSVPLVGIEITGSAEGGLFDYYTLRYSWGGDPPVNNAVVYPDCSRPPASVNSNVPVTSGTLGYLDLTLLPPGVTEFTIYLDVYSAGGGHVSVTRTFKLKTTAVEITAAATVEALEAEDPFHPGSSTKLIKATNDPDIAVPEVSIGGAFSVSGSAYIIGCNRIMSQFVLARFDALPANPVPTFPDAAGGTPLITPVVYDGTTAHPWQSGCLSNITDNTVRNGNLVAFWSKQNCKILGMMPYTVPKVKPVPFWNSDTLNGRYVILLEVQDVPIAGGVSIVAAVDQVVVWIDNQEPEAQITSIGGLKACEDLYLSQFVKTTAEIRGVAWDPPIVPTAPQKPPNDNFGSYSLSFKKNGVTGAPGIPAATPNTRVPNVWPGPVTTDGVLANWDIVGALDGGAGPLPANSHKLVRRERCAYTITLHVTDTTHVGDSGNHHWANYWYAINIINDI
jgi:hypothetical protein